MHGYTDAIWSATIRMDMMRAHNPTEIRAQENEIMAKDKGQKKKDREKKVAAKKLAEAQQRATVAKQNEPAKTNLVARTNTMSKGVGGTANAQTSNVTKQFSHRRMGGGG